LNFAFPGASNSFRPPAKPIQRDAELNPPAAVAPKSDEGGSFAGSSRRNEVKADVRMQSLPVFNVA
jgi:hypothetical protein